MKIGILFCGYNSEEYVRDSLKPFEGRDNFIISAVSVPFLEYQNQQFFEDNTTEILLSKYESGGIKYLVNSPRFIREHEARNQALRHLLREGVDLIWLVDADEIYTNTQIDDILTFVKNNEAYWYSLSLKNFVFDKNTYLKEPFTPPRIFRKSFFEYSLHSFYWDNDIVYTNGLTGKIYLYTEFENISIPKSVAWIDHYSWLSDNIGKRKVRYQQDHFGHCSYKWNEEEEQIEFDEEFFEKFGQEKPQIIHA